MTDPITRLNAALEGRYRVEREIGEGGMATVYLAEDLRHERKVALKVLKPELAAVVGAERFLAEIKTTGGRGRASQRAPFSDTARIYGRGRAEEVIGQILRELDARDDVFIATKVPTPETREQAVASLEACMTALGVEHVSAMRVHFLDGVEILLPILREWKEAGRVRYLGVTTMSAEQYPELERLIREENLDMIEIDYSVLDRAAAERILPLAAGHGVAVVVARPFAGRRGGVFSFVAGRPLPDFASEIGATSWAQLCLKYTLSNPAVTVVIPGTDDPEHMVDNMGAGRGELPDADLRRRIEQIFDELGG